MLNVVWYRLRCLYVSYIVSLRGKNEFEPHPQNEIPVPFRGLFGKKKKKKRGGGGGGGGGYFQNFRQSPPTPPHFYTGVSPPPRVNTYTNC